MNKNTHTQDAYDVLSLSAPTDNIKIDAFYFFLEVFSTVSQLIMGSCTNNIFTLSLDLRIIFANVTLRIYYNLKYLLYANDFLTFCIWNE